MRTLRTTLLALIGALALGATVASTALAAPEWYVKKGGTFKKVSTAVHVQLEASKFGVIREEKSSGNLLGLECTVTEAGNGTIESAGHGTITSFGTFASPRTHCTAVKKGSKSGIYVCEKITKTESGDFNWSTELLAGSGETRAKIAEHTGGAEPFFEFTCEAGLLGLLPSTCGLKTTTHVSNVENAVSLTFDTKTAKTECAVNEKEAAEWKGAVVVKPTKAEKEAGVEAIKVE